MISYNLFWCALKRDYSGRLPRETASSLFLPMEHREYFPRKMIVTFLKAFETSFIRKVVKNISDLNEQW